MAFHLIEVAQSGKSIGAYRLGSETVGSFSERFSTLRRSKGLVVGKETERKQYCTKAIFLSPEFGPIEWRLVVTGKGPMRRSTSLLNRT